jgi:hypothetical protein
MLYLLINHLSRDLDRLPGAAFTGVFWINFSNKKELWKMHFRDRLVFFCRSAILRKYVFRTTSLSFLPSVTEIIPSMPEFHDDADGNDDAEDDDDVGDNAEDRIGMVESFVLI